MNEFPGITKFDLVELATFEDVKDEHRQVGT